MIKTGKAIQDLRKAMLSDNINPKNGMPLDLFEFSTTLLPFVNVDLFIHSKDNQFLLSWRDDVHYGTGWQIPGGIIRMTETIDERIQKTAIKEIGCTVEYDREPIIVYENIIQKHRDGLKNQLERAHNIALLFRCRLPDNYLINNGKLKETEEGYLRWFDYFPETLLECHKMLKKYGVMNQWFVK